MDSLWVIDQLSYSDRQLVKNLARELSISDSSAQLLVQRGLRTADAARRFIRPTLSELHDPYQMNDMRRAVDRIVKAIESDEKIMIYGDYDVDGTTAVALAYRYMSYILRGKQKDLINIDYYIPDRYTEGYGISFKGIDEAELKGCSLIIALDCGIRSIDKVQYAKQKGIDFIICDHHLPESNGGVGSLLPAAVAVLDSKRSDNTYPYNELSGCGVGFKLMQALQEHYALPFESLMPLLELCAMSIASDIVPVTGENRILAYFGLQRINSSPSVGVKALMDTASLTEGQISISDLVYRIGPRINACGRIHTGREAVSLLLTDDIEQARELSEAVNEHNNTRKGLDQQITNEALRMLSKDVDNETKTTTVVCGENWHKGVIGIVASRLTETYFRPTIVLTELDGMVTGSARSVGGFDIYSAIDSCRDLLTNFGGHTFAAGLSMMKENLGEFKQRFEQYVSKHILPEQQRPVIHIDQVLRFEDITSQFYNVIRHLEPFGPGNKRPLFATYGVRNYRYTRAVGKNGEHLKLDVTDGTGAMQGIAFGKGEMSNALLAGKAADICYELQTNTFNGSTTLQMMVEDIV